MIIKVAKYSRDVKKHLEKSATKVTRAELVMAHEYSVDLLNEIKHEISTQEYRYAEQTIDKRRVPTPQLLYKDHKKPNAEGDYPTQLLVPAGNFTAAFPHLGWKAIEALLKKYKINYQRKNIINAYDLKKTLEKLNIKYGQHTIITMDIVAMYPSVKFLMILKAVNYFLRNASESDKRKAKLALELVRFGMTYTFLQFETNIGSMEETNQWTKKD